LASEYLSKDHGIDVSRETVRNWMAEAKLWRVKTQCLEKIHAWRARRSRPGELVQWGHQRTRLAGEARRDALSDQHDCEAISNR
jgi:hypothetical protein